MQSSFTTRQEAQWLVCVVETGFPSPAGVNDRLLHSESLQLLSSLIALASHSIAGCRMVPCHSVYPSNVKRKKVAKIFVHVKVI